MTIRKMRARRGDGAGRVYIYVGISLDKDKVKEFVSGSVGQKSWDEAKEQFARQTDADIVDIFEWASKREKDK